MAIIVTQTADNAYHAQYIQDALRRLGRDYYPFGVYEAIYYLIQETHGEDEVYKLDVIAWCCDLSESELCNNPEFEDTEALAEHLRGYTIVLYYDDETVYHLAY